jgi:hypothetical protein
MNPLPFEVRKQELCVEGPEQSRGAGLERLRVSISTEQPHVAPYPHAQ